MRKKNNNCFYMQFYFHNFKKSKYENASYENNIAVETSNAVFKFNSKTVFFESLQLLIVEA